MSQAYDEVKTLEQQKTENLLSIEANIEFMLNEYARKREAGEQIVPNEWFLRLSSVYGYVLGLKHLMSK
jgi:hypothetical protein